ncbi:hypothetical protein [Rubritalea sp.]|uniref:hypothetical protein n=1 Tax=Rubritalea sp. TaxID=2109375 RepID=UPI003EF956C5
MKPLALSILLSSALYGATPIAAVYVPPTDSIFIKVDQLPLDVVTMHELASTLLQVSVSQPEYTPESLRYCAKLIAIVTQLDPHNDQLESTNRTLLNRERELTEAPPLNPASVEDASLALILQYLGNKKQGTEANQLAQRLKNTLHSLHPNNPHYRSEDPITHSWDHIVAPLADFSVNPEVALIDTQRVNHSEEPTGGLFNNAPLDDIFIEKLDQVPEAPKLAEWKIATQSVLAPLSFTIDKESFDTVNKVNVPVRAKENSSSNKITFNSESLNSISSGKYKLALQLSTILQKEWPDGFKSSEITININSPLSKSTDVDVLAASASIILDASLLNQLLPPNLLVAMGQNTSGEFTRNARFWDYIPELIKLEKNHRILVANGAVGDLRQLLVTTDSDLFIRQEIFVVDDLKDSRSYRGVKLDENLTKASAIFKEIQEVLEGKSTRSMATNSHVRSKLKEVLALNPRHLSAKMLLILGSNEKANTIDTKYLGYEINTVLEKVKPSVSSTYHDTEGAEKLISLGDEIENDLEILRRHTSAEDRNILTNVDNFAKTLQSAGRSKLKSSDYESVRQSYYAKSYDDDIRELKSMFNTLSIQAAQLIGKN